MTKILFYAYCRGVFSFRKIDIRLFEDVSFIVLAGGEKPDFRTINEFRRSLPSIFVQILKLCEKAGLVGLKHVWKEKGDRLLFQGVIRQPDPALSLTLTSYPPNK